MDSQNTIESVLQNGRIAILDGGFGTEVEARGANITEDELWAAKCLDTCPELAVAVHKDYIMSGSDIILTASYKASIDDFLKFGFSEEKAITLIKKSVHLAKQAREEAWASLTESQQIENRPYPLIAASVSSYGAFLYGEEYTGNYGGISDEDLMAFHRKQIRLLAEEKPDILAIETVPLMQEIRVFLKLIQEPEFEQLGVPIWIAVTCKDDSHLGSGEPIQDITDLLKKDGIPKLLKSIGINCCPPQFVANLVSILSKNCDLPILVYANTGETYDKVNRVWINEDGNIKDKHQAYCDYAQIWVDAGAKLVGGCCRTSPQTISVLSNHFNKK